MMKWRRGRPKKDGTYIVTTFSGRVTDYFFTTDGGWNTTRENDGSVDKACAIEDEFVRGWIPYPAPMPDPDAIEFDVDWGNENE